MQPFRPGHHTILLVDEDAAAARPIVLALREHGYEIQHVRSAAAALASIRRKIPSLLAIEAVLPDGSGLCLCTQLKAEPDLAGLPIIIISARGAEPDRVAGFESGADDYMVKPVSPAELLLRVRARLLAARPKRPTADSIRVGPVELFPARFQAQIGGRPIRLSASEFRLLSRLVTAPNQVLTREALRELATGPGRRVLDSRVKRLRRKLGPLADSIETVRGQGYRFRLDS
jgi:two-component system phosphate regulon response regulator PhoB